VPALYRVDPRRDQRDVEHQDRGVEHQHRPESDPGDAEVLVHRQDHEPDAHHEALLQQEGIVAEAQQPHHVGVGLAAPALEPDQREEGVEDVEREDAHHQQHVGAVETVDVDALALA